MINAISKMEWIDEKFMGEFKPDQIGGKISIVAMTKKPIIDEFGNIKNIEDIKEDFGIKNTIVYSGRAIMAKYTADNTFTSNMKINYFAIGDGETNPPAPASKTDTDLKNQTYIKAIDVKSEISSVSRLFTTVIDADEATGEFNEMALKFDDTGKTLWARTTRETFNKEPGIFLIFRWVVLY